MIYTPKIQKAIDFAKEQYKELLLLVLLGSWVRGGVADLKGEYSPAMDELEDYLLGKAKDFDLEHLAENFKGHMVPKDTFAKEYEKIIEEYNDDQFWYELITLLGKRDFYEQATKEELEEIEKSDGWLSRRVDQYYQKYQSEFEKHGIERLRIQSKD